MYKFAYAESNHSSWQSCLKDSNRDDYVYWERVNYDFSPPLSLPKSQMALKHYNGKAGILSFPKDTSVETLSLVCKCGSMLTFQVTNHLLVGSSESTPMDLSLSVMVCQHTACSEHI